ncbi:hypothetical protein [Nocardia sp. NPDC005978]|uniref:hypothetical protein n=1 Tax=unclassified Nocardia TaxID=2637762 RepID=UPI0033B3F479
MTNPYFARSPYPRRETALPQQDSAQSPDGHPAWHARPGAYAAMSDRDIDDLLDRHPPDCWGGRCLLRRYLLELRERRGGGEVS